MILDDTEDETIQYPWRYIFRLTIPVAMAYVPLGVAFGIFLVSSGINWYWAPLSALIIFAGSIEFLAVSFIIAGLSVSVVAWTTLIVNFRHIFYGLSFPIKRLPRKWQKIYGVYALTDETYGITSAGVGKQLSGNNITLLQVISHSWWVGGALLGSLVGVFIPPEIKGFDFALTAMFLILTVDAVKHDHSLRLILYAAIACSVGFIFEQYIVDSSYLASGLITYLILITKDYFYTEKSLDND
jgi:4-azaleucine resistance transporter AzlC